MSVAKAYARALFEAARDSKVSSQDLDRVEQELDSIAKLVESSKEARVALFAPAVSAKDKMSVVQEIGRKAGFLPLVSNFLVLLARKERFNLISEVRDSFSAVRLEQEGGIQGRIVSADPLDPADLEGLTKAFSQKLGKRVAFRTSTDPALLAGMQVSVAGVTYDGSLRSQLQRLRDRLVYGTGTAH